MNSSHAFPEIRTMSDAKVQAFRHPLVAPPPHGFNGGLVLGDAKSDKRLRQSRYWNVVDRFDAGASFDNRLAGDFIYFGPIYHHFGHMMAEMVHRVVPSKSIFGKRKFLLVGLQNDLLINSYHTLPKFLLELLEFFQIPKNDVVILNNDTTVSSLAVCEPGSDFGGGPKEGYLRCLREFTSPRLDALHGTEPSYSKVYVSRGNAKHGGSFLGENYLQILLQEEGFEIFHPEEHSVSFQMHVYRSADILIFPEGSACHGVELLGDNTLENCYLLERRPDHREIFSRVLQPRAKNFGRFAHSKFLGTAAVHPDDGSPLDNVGVSLLDIDALAVFFRENGIAKFPKYNWQVYLDYAEFDLKKYRDHYISASSPIEARTLMDQLARRFIEIRKSVNCPSMQAGLQRILDSRLMTV